jgi:3-oxoacyl-(acyl-carrier-protein) synthase
MSKPVYIAGLGVISAIGNNVADHLVAFKNEAAGMGAITHFESVHKGYCRLPK